MNILLCTSEVGNNAGGLAFHCDQLKDVFEKLGHNVSVEVLLEFNEYYALDGGYDPGLGKKIRTASKLKTMIEKYGDRIDLCISCGSGRTAYFAMLFCKQKNIPLIIVLCGSEINIAWDSVEITYFNSEAFKYTTAIVGLSEELNRNAKIIGVNSNCEFYTVPIICDMSDKPRKIEDSIKDRLVFVSGSAYLGEKKGIANLLCAFSYLKKEFNRNDMLYLYGEIDEDVKEQYMRIIEENSLENNVVLMGYLQRDDFIKEMRNADVYIQASPFEGYGISVVEALDTGTDLLITNTGYIAERIRDEYSEHIFTTFEPGEMAAEINAYINDVYPRNEKGKIRELLKKDLSSSTILNKWKNILNKVNTNRIINSNENCLAVMFHDVDTIYSGVEYTVEGFRNMMYSLYVKGYKLCSAKQYFESSDKNGLVICTFDDGYENVYRNAFPIMKEYGFTATVFVCPDLIGKNNSWNHRDEVNRVHMSYEMIDKLVIGGWEVGSHGLSHMNMVRLSEHELDLCLGESKKMLEKYGEIETYCYPYGVFNSYIKEKTKKYYSRAFSVTIGGSDYLNDLYQITRLTPEDLIKKLNLLL